MRCTPGSVGRDRDRADGAVCVLEQRGRRILGLHRLRAPPRQAPHRRRRPRKVTEQIERVRRLVHQHAAALARPRSAPAGGAVVAVRAIERVDDRDAYELAEPAARDQLRARRRSPAGSAAGSRRRAAALPGPLRRSSRRPRAPRQRAASRRARARPLRAPRSRAADETDAACRRRRRPAPARAARGDRRTTASGLLRTRHRGSRS